ncbi:hypothetical protein HMPREF1214_02554 [Bacteroides sp. HPS0048]|nr:hypothetical protein HMPREF1214_02554 [Bacteroides sp. HPS0048]
MFATFFLYSTTCSNNCFIKMTLLIKKSSQELITHSKNIFYRIIIKKVYNNSVYILNMQQLKSIK